MALFAPPPRARLLDRLFAFRLFGERFRDGLQAALRLVEESRRRRHHYPRRHRHPLQADPHRRPRQHPQPQFDRPSQLDMTVSRNDTLRGLHRLKFQFRA